MREGWTYKKLGEVCEIYQPKTISKKDCLTNGDYLVYGANGVIGTYNEYNHENSEVLLGCRGTVGNVIVSKPYSWINGNAMVIHPKNTDLLQFFLAYQLRGIDLSSVITGVAQPQITRQALSPTIIAIPPISIQQQIVSELDLLSSVIEKQKAQIEELDKLAQSIFYDMFGDPVENEKGWKVQKLGNVCEYAKTRIKSEEVSKDNYVGVDNLLQKCMGKTNAAKVPEGLGLTKYIEGDVLIGNIRPYLKKAWLADRKGGCNGDVLSIRRKEVYENKLNTMYLYKCLSDDKFFDFAMHYAKGEKMPRGDKKEIMNYSILMPPLSLQQQFAFKIEAIEHQKELIKQSIQEAEMLFNSRMNFYFNQ